MAIAPDERELLELESNSAIALLDNEEADESLWQQDCATAMSSEQTLSERQKRLAAGRNFPVIFWLALLHVGALAAPFCFSWEGLAVCMALYWLSGSVGVCLGYHRLLTHGAFKVHKPTRWLLAFLGGLSGEGSALDWVANHRKHHAHSDHDGDPHSPHDGGLWAHMLWLGWSIKGDAFEAHVRRWAPDLGKDPVMRWIGHMFLPSHILTGLVLAGVGQWMGGPYMAASLLVWGLFVRLVIVLHVTWFVNSWSHMWGYRTYETTDDSRNNWLVALLAFGEGWHNNHHAYPRMAAQGHKWWEIDMTYWVILAMKWTGLAWDVVDYKKISDRNR
ncbi:MAG: acyl-CoA desaturase [Planctomycetaceae bacterium]|nr:acyl-CoA desaturase [Planctomycetales bacterium]MCB9923364.1 acyl-CoA desaturase [Planctomycetaceae bacterium]